MRCECNTKIPHLSPPCHLYLNYFHLPLNQRDTRGCLSRWSCSSAGLAHPLSNSCSSCMAKPPIITTRWPQVHPRTGCVVGQRWPKLPACGQKPSARHASPHHMRVRHNCVLPCAAYWDTCCWSHASAAQQHDTEMAAAA